MHEGDEKPRRALLEVTAPPTKLMLNLRRSQAKFLRHLAAATNLEPSDICQRLIDLAVQPEPEWQDDILYRVSVQNTLASFSCEPDGGNWVNVSIYLDTKHFDYLCSFAAKSRASSSNAMRHLLAGCMSKFDIASERHQKTGGFRSRPRLFSKFLSHSAPFIVGTVALLFVIVIFGLWDGSSIKVGPHWAGNNSSLVFDPHTHTSYSDGALSPTDLVELAVQSGCEALVISDHSDSDGTVSDQQLAELQHLREKYPDLLLFSGIELNMPSYGGREHAGLIAAPSVESGVLQNMRDVAERSLKRARKGGGHKAFDVELLQIIADYQSLQNGLLLVYNHPSRKVSDLSESLSDLTKWNTPSPVFIAIEGGPGHQNDRLIGSYEEPHLTVDRWDPVVAKVGGVWDQLLSDGHQFWAALASSDYHNDGLDEAPCAFSRTHLIVPEQSYRGALMAIKAGTFWSDHGRILNQLWFSVHVDGLEQPAYPGYTVYVDNRDSLGIVTISIERGPGSFGQPLSVEFIGNCASGDTEVLAVKDIPPEGSTTSASIPLAATGRDGRSCTLRARVRLSRDSSTDYLAYTNPVRLILD